MLRNLSADVICSEKRTVFRERSSRKTVSFAVVRFCTNTRMITARIGLHSVLLPLLILQIFFATRRICQSVTSVNHVKRFSIGFQNFHVFQFRFRFSRKHMLEEKAQHFKGKNNSVKGKSKIQVVNKVTGNLTTFREQDQSNIAFRKMRKPP